MHLQRRRHEGDSDAFYTQGYVIDFFYFVNYLFDYLLLHVCMYLLKCLLKIKYIQILFMMYRFPEIVNKHLLDHDDARVPSALKSHYSLPRFYAPNNNRALNASYQLV